MRNFRVLKNTFLFILVSIFFVSCGGGGGGGSSLGTSKTESLLMM